MKKHLVGIIAATLFCSPAYAAKSVVPVTDTARCYNINGDVEPCTSPKVVAQKLCIYPQGLAEKCFAVDKMKIKYTSEDGHKCTTSLDRIGANVDTVCTK